MHKSHPLTVGRVKRKELPYRRARRASHYVSLALLAARLRRVDRRVEAPTRSSLRSLLDDLSRRSGSSRFPLSSFGAVLCLGILQADQSDFRRIGDRSVEMCWLKPTGYARSDTAVVSQPQPMLITSVEVMITADRTYVPRAARVIFVSPLKRETTDNGNFVPFVADLKSGIQADDRRWLDEPGVRLFSRPGVDDAKTSRTDP